MAKQVHRASKIILGGVDVSHFVTAWHVGAAVGALYTCTLTLLDSPQLLTITPRGEQQGNWGLRVATDDLVEVVTPEGGTVDISRWIGGYRKIVAATEADTVELDIQCDRDVLSINGTHPWEDAG
ncbi:hypothetical protein [Streptomyces hydrogenans]|uniref:Uncharacterized protein n=1 Tax=Streptomyces hydrogenans TaxID=1873719 RepID=A0ABQ3PJK8_9ACTN|nr:hypothetical protein [Streptomyces hydrogenans]GHG10056.1 hypothetical protein GCM10018784_23410 [Streptomyces hydrogenans]GHI25207.1 hypothetical protein Shyd_65780 [Streptomyces hydrogenans]